MGIELLTFGDCVYKLGIKHKDRNKDVVLELTKANKLLKDYCGTLKGYENEKQLKASRLRVAYEIADFRLGTYRNWKYEHW